MIVIYDKKAENICKGDKECIVSVVWLYFIFQVKNI